MRTKIVLIILTVIGAFSIKTFSENTVEKITPTYNESPQVCQFSLSLYSGTLDSDGDTGLFTVGLSCPQEETTYATVVLFVDDMHTASTVVKISAGNTRSDSTRIKAGRENAGKKYRLVVQ